MAIHKISINYSDYDKLETLVSEMPHVMVMRAEWVTRPNGEKSATVFLRIDNPIDLSYILLMVSGKQLRHP